MKAYRAQTYLNDGILEWPAGERLRDSIAYVLEISWIPTGFGRLWDGDPTGQVVFSEDNPPHWEPPNWTTSVDAALDLPISNWFWVLIPDALGKSAASLARWPRHLYEPTFTIDDIEPSAKAFSLFGAGAIPVSQGDKVFWGRAGKDEFALAMCRAWLQLVAYDGRFWS